MWKIRNVFYVRSICEKSWTVSKASEKAERGNLISPPKGEGWVILAAHYLHLKALKANYATYVSFFRWHQNAVVMGEGRLVWWSRDPGSQTWDPQARWILGSSCKQHSPTEDLAGGWVLLSSHQLTCHISCPVSRLKHPCPEAAPTAHRRSLWWLYDQWSPVLWSNGWFLIAALSPTDSYLRTRNIFWREPAFAQTKRRPWPAANLIWNKRR